MFPTPKQRYYRYVAFCVLLGQNFLSFEGWKRETDKIQDQKPIAWMQSSSVS